MCGPLNWSLAICRETMERIYSYKSNIYRVAMNQLTQIELSNWLALYVAAGLCCAIAFALACATAAFEIYRDRSWSTVKSVRSAVLFLPRTWWRWQKLYLTSTPVTLGIVSLFAASMRWA